MTDKTSFTLNTVTGKRNGSDNQAFPIQWQTGLWGLSIILVLDKCHLFLCPEYLSTLSKGNLHDSVWLKPGLLVTKKDWEIEPNSCLFSPYMQTSVHIDRGGVGGGQKGTPDSIHSPYALHLRKTRFLFQTRNTLHRSQKSWLSLSATECERPTMASISKAVKIVLYCHVSHRLNNFLNMSVHNWGLVLYCHVSHSLNNFLKVSVHNLFFDVSKIIVKWENVWKSVRSDLSVLICKLRIFRKLLKLSMSEAKMWWVL